MMRRLVRPLDRYVFSEFVRIFIVTVMGFPVLIDINDLAENLEKYLNRSIPHQAIALSYIYWIPDSIFMVFPAAVLFATVFSISGLTRHSEVTAAKASGISFYRLIAPIMVGAAMAAVFGLALGELVPITTAKRNDILEEDKSTRGTERYNFVYAAENGRVYKAASLSVPTSQMTGFQIERKGNDKPDYPTVVISAATATFADRLGWTLHKGTTHVVTDNGPDFAVSFDSLKDRGMIEMPADLLATPRSPHEMGYRDLGRFIRALQRSGGDVNELRVEQALKIAIPVTCLIIALFGAPLATSTQRGGAAYGIGVSLGVTIIFLMMIQLTKAIGSKGLMPPDLAAWVPSMIFAAFGVVLLTRVRT